MSSRPVAVSLHARNPTAKVAAHRNGGSRAMNSSVTTKLVTAAAAFLICAGVTTRGGDAARAAEPPSPGAEVMVVKAVTFCFSDTIGVTGFLVPREEAIVNLDAEGYRISEMMVKEGATVTAGQDMVKLARLTAESAPNPQALPGARPMPATMVLKSPAAGLVTRSTAMIGAVASMLQREPLFRIMINGEIELEADVPSIHVHKLRADGRQTARVELENGTELTGRVRMVPGEVDRMTQLAKVRLSVDRSPALRVGMFARATIDASRSCGVAVPRAAVTYRTEGTSVQLIRNNVVETKKIVTGLTSDTDIEVRTGVLEGDVLVASAGTSLHDGDKVKPVLAKRPDE
jgi:multidrug efflux pump subunit AcrA (membrane-fusion protein)